MTDTASSPIDPVAAAPAGTTDRPAGKLHRSIGVGGGTLLTLSCVTPASSLFVIVPPLFAELGTGTAMTIALAAVLCIGVAFCYSELGTLVPSAGGEYAMVGTLVGRFAGWMLFVLSLIIVLIVPPIIAVGTAEYISPILHVSPEPTGAAVMVAAMLMGLLNLRSNAWITGIFLGVEILAVAVVSWLGFSHVTRPTSVLTHPVLLNEGHLSLVSAATIISGLAISLFVLQGFSTAVYLAEEMHNPRRTVARTVLLTLAMSAVIILVPVVAITLGAPDPVTLAGGDIAAMVVGWSNSGVGVFVSLCIAAAIINAVIVMVIQNSRVLFASARDRAWPQPVNAALSRLSPRFGSPWVATLVVGLCGAALCYVPVETLNGLTSVVIVAMYLGVTGAALVARRGRHSGAPAWRMPLWPAIPVLVSVALLYVLTQQTALDLLLAFGVVLLAVGYWMAYLRPRQASRWVVTVPVD